MKAVVLAAGVGSRVNTGWTIVPKPLMKIREKTIIEHVIAGLKEAGVIDILIVTGFMSEHIKDRLRDGVELGVNLRYVYNKDYKKDILRSLMASKEALALQDNEKFLLVMADLYFKGEMIKEFIEFNGDARSNVLLANSAFETLLKFEAKNKLVLSNNSVVSAGYNLDEFDAIDSSIYLFDKNMFALLEKCISQNGKEMPDLINELAKNNAIFAFDHKTCEVIDIDSREDAKYVAHKLLEEGTQDSSS